MITLLLYQRYDNYQKLNSKIKQYQKIEEMDEKELSGKKKMNMNEVKMKMKNIIDY